MENLLCAVGCALGLFGIAAAVVIALLWIVASAVASIFSRTNERLMKEGGRKCEISLKA